MRFIYQLLIAVAALAFFASIVRGADPVEPMEPRPAPAADANGVLKASASTTTPAKAAAAAAPAVAAPAKSIPSPTINATVTEWVVLVADVSNPQMNARNL